MRPKVSGLRNGARGISCLYAMEAETLVLSWNVIDRLVSFL